MMNNNKGIALILVLWVMALLTVMALSFSFTAKSSTAGARNFKDDAVLFYRAQSSIEEARAYILGDRDPDVDYLDAEGVLRFDQKRPALPLVHEADGITVTLRIIDEEGKLNVNRVVLGHMRDALLNAGAKEEQVPVLIDSFMDWVDADDLHRLEGAEDEFYKPLGYKARNFPLTVIDELRLVRGFEEEPFNLQSLAPYLSSWGEKVNVNTAPANVLVMLGMDEVFVQAFIEQRTEEKGVRAVPAALGQFGALRSDVFRLEATARIADSAQTLTITTVVRRTVSGEDTKLMTLYWKESYENSSS